MKKILIIEDHYEFVKRAINAIAHNDAGEDTNVLITATADAEMACILLNREWDVILIDHDLPNRYSGWQLLNNHSKFREIDKAKIIAISAVPDNNLRLVQHGAHYSINKMDGNFEERLQAIMGL